MERFLLPIILSLFVALGLDTYFVLYVKPETSYLILFVLILGYVTNIVFALLIYFIKTRKVSLIELKKKGFRSSYKLGAILGILVVLLFIIQITFDVL